MTDDKTKRIREAALRLRQPVPKAAVPKPKKAPQSWRKLKMGTWLASGKIVYLEGVSYPVDTTWEVTQVTAMGVNLTPISILPKMSSVFLADAKWEQAPWNFRKVPKARNAKNHNLKLGA